METEIKMLSDIHKNADMGQDTLRHILEEKGLQTDIEIDGGVDTKNLRMVIEAGANVLVSGSKIFGGDIAENVHQFKAIMAEYTK